MTDPDNLRQRSDSIEQASLSRGQRKKLAKAEAEAEAADRGRINAAQVRVVAGYQSHVLRAVLLQVVGLPLLVLVTGLLSEALGAGEAGLTFVLVAALVAAVGLFAYGEWAQYKLHRALDKSTAASVTALIVGLLPLIGLLVLLSISGEANKFLKHHGVQVGLLGARASTLPS